MIEVKNLRKNYGKSVKALDHISFDIQKGEIVGLLGPNGAGKTTTMKILTGYMPMSSGSVKIGGIDIMEDSLAVRKQIGYLPENAPLYSDMTVQDTLQFAARMHSLSKEESKAALERVLDECALGDKIHEKIDHLSKGYRQRVGLAQALISDPDILILDEPTVGLDPNQIIEIRELIKKIGKQKTVILSSHILAEVEATCDRVFIINHGQIVASGTPEELRARGEGQSKILIKALSQGSRDLGAALSSLPGILKVSNKKSHEHGVEVWETEIEKGKDLRKELVNFMREQGFQLLELSREDMKLEDIFTELTREVIKEV